MQLALPSDSSRPEPARDRRCRADRRQPVRDEPANAHPAGGPAPGSAADRRRIGLVAVVCRVGNEPADHAKTEAATANSDLSSAFSTEFGGFEHPGHQRLCRFRNRCAAAQFPAGGTATTMVMCSDCSKDPWTALTVSRPAVRCRRSRPLSTRAASSTPFPPGTRNRSYSYFDTYLTGGVRPHAAAP